MKSFTDTISLRRFGLGFCVLDIVDGQEQLIVVGFCAATVFGTPVSENAQHGQLLGLVKGQYFIVQQISCGDRCFSSITSTIVFMERKL